jgi:16S rRNA (guanine966-N2)-methyltransferase
MTRPANPRPGLPVPYPMSRTQKTQIRIVAGSLRGRRLSVVVHPGLRPTPQMVREALFSILGNAVPERPFFDVFAGTGVNGLEALSRGAKSATFIERDARLAADIDAHLKEFGLAGQSQVLRIDAYRWADRWLVPAEPVNLFLSPPFADLTDRSDDFLRLVLVLCEKLPRESVIVIQGEEGFDADRLPEAAAWEQRKYGRNLLLLRVIGESGGTQPAGNDTGEN